MDNPQERLLSKDFIAGLIVGEGWFGLTVQKTPRLKTKYGFTLRPRFAIQMNDEETMSMLRASLDAAGIAYHVPKDATRVEIAGMQRMVRLTDWILPHLTGDKLRAAKIVREFCDLRMSKKQSEPYGPDEFRLVDKIRAHNAGNGDKAGASLGELRDVRLSQKNPQRLHAMHP